jgi:uncharacterized circularly permuted ATP-grasp superfamily protein
MLMDSIWEDYRTGGFFDELVDDSGQPRVGCADVVPRLTALGSELFERQKAAEAVINSMGVTFTLYTEEGSIDRSWPVDVIPRIIEVDEWNRVSTGLIQRLAGLKHFIDDL